APTERKGNKKAAAKCRRFFEQIEVYFLGFAAALSSIAVISGEAGRGAAPPRPPPALLEPDAATSSPATTGAGIFAVPKFSGFGFGTTPLARSMTVLPDQSGISVRAP